MPMLEDVRRHCARVAASARSVTIDLAAAAAQPAPPASAEALRDDAASLFDGPVADRAAFWLTLDTINFGSGWFPTLRKRPGCSGYFTVALSLAEHFRRQGPWPAQELRRLDAGAVASVLGQRADHELMELYAEALRQLGRFLGARTALAAVGDAGGSAEGLATSLARGMPFFYDPGFYKRAQIAAHDLARACVAQLTGLDRLTIFADNLVPHVLRVDGILRYDERLAAHIDSGELLPPGEEEREIRACALHACELIGARTGVPPRVLDEWLWNRGQAPEYKAIPRHRTRCVYY